MTGNDFNQSLKMHFILGIKYLVGKNNTPARGRLVIDDVVMPRVYVS